MSFILLYALQTGQAEAISDQITNEAELLKLQPRRHNISKINDAFSLDDEKCVVIVISTTGEGEMPDSCRNLQKYLRKLSKNQAPLSHLSYAILGLGDTNYTNFCNGSRLLEKKFEQLGASAFYTTGYADDATGLENVVEPWIENLWPILQEKLGEREAESASSIILSSQTEENTRLKQSDTIEVTSQDIFGFNKLSSNSDSTGNKMTNMLPNFLCSHLVMTLRNVKRELNEDKENISVPTRQQSFLLVKYLESNETFDSSNAYIEWVKDSEHPSARSGIINCDITGIKQLTSEDAKKRTLKTILTLPSQDKESIPDVFPGDAIGVIVQNPMEEVNFLLHRLDVATTRNCPIQIVIDSKTQKKNASLPCYIPKDVTSIEFVLTYCLEIRAVVKKAFLREVAEHCSDEAERTKLLLLCSKEGTNLYTKLIREQHTGVCEILAAFSSCKPPIQVLLEYLPRLQPRPYSISNYPIRRDDDRLNLEIVFNIVDLPSDNTKRMGVCTGYFYNIYNSHFINSLDLSTRLDQLSLSNSHDDGKVDIYIRSSTSFRLLTPLRPEMHVIMVGPGTGVAPFIGFLQHRELLLKSSSSSDVTTKYWLFYGCRHPNKDFIFKSELESFVDNNILSQLTVAYSQYNNSKLVDGEVKKKEYVQHKLMEHSELVLSILLDKYGYLYVCGDAKGMAVGVYNTLIDLMVRDRDMTRQQSVEILCNLQQTGHYKQDVWT